MNMGQSATTRTTTKKKPLATLVVVLFLVVAASLASGGASLVVGIGANANGEHGEDGGFGKYDDPNDVKGDATGGSVQGLTSVMISTLLLHGSQSVRDCPIRSRNCITPDQPDNNQRRTNNGHALIALGGLHLGWGARVHSRQRCT